MPVLSMLNTSSSQRIYKDPLTDVTVLGLFFNFVAFAIKLHHFQTLSLNHRYHIFDALKYVIDICAGISTASLMIIEAVTGSFALITVSIHICSFGNNSGNFGCFTRSLFFLTSLEKSTGLFY